MTAKVNDIVYWNVNDFDMVKPLSYPCVVEEVRDDGIVCRMVNEEDTKLFFDKNDLGDICTSRPQYKIVIGKMKEEKEL